MICISFSIVYSDHFSKQQPLPKLLQHRELTTVHNGLNTTGKAAMSRYVNILIPVLQINWQGEGG